MNSEEFGHVFHEVIDLCGSILANKAVEYAPNKDKLHNFKTAASLADIEVKQALAGMMAKHTVSIYDMCYSKGKFDLETWDEKIIDHINYLILLRAIVVEEIETANCTPPVNLTL